MIKLLKSSILLFLDYLKWRISMLIWRLLGVLFALNAYLHNTADAQSAKGWDIEFASGNSRVILRFAYTLSPFSDRWKVVGGNTTLLPAEGSYRYNATSKKIQPIEVASMWWLNYPQGKNFKGIQCSLTAPFRYQGEVLDNQGGTFPEGGFRWRCLRAL